MEQPFIAVAYTLGGALKGAVMRRGRFWRDLSAVFIRLPLVYQVVYVLHLNVVYLRWVMSLQFMVTMLLLMSLYRRTEWQRLAHKPSFKAMEI